MQTRTSKMDLVMPIIILIVLLSGYSVQAAILVDHSKVDLSKIINTNNSKTFFSSSQELSYIDTNVVKVRQKTLVRKQQLHYGIPIYGHFVVTELSNHGFSKPIDGKVLTDIESDIDSTLPMINMDQAIDIAKGKQKGIVATSIEDTKADLMIWVDDQQTAYLTYKVELLSRSGMTPSRPITIVDAKSGNILDSWDGLNFIDAEGPGGNQKSGRYYFGTNTKYGSFQVNNECQMDSANVVTLNMNNQEYGGWVHQFDCHINNYRAVNGAYAPMNDAHYFGQRVFDMYMEWLNTRPIQQKLTMRVHYGYNYGNAFWDGQQMTFGDGNQSMYPLATWDVIAHEVSHGFTEQNSGLEYRGMSGGINESFSDVAAAALSEYVHGSFNWKMGEHVMKYSDAMRYFIHPSQDGRSIDHVNQYYQGIDVHHSSGIFNKAFYHLATSDGWNIKQAFIAYATANQLYWRPNSSFQQGADSVCKAAQKLGYDTAAVRSAFAQVGIEVQNCGVSQPIPIPQPTPNIVVLSSNEPIVIDGTKGNQQQFVLKKISTDEASIYTYNGYGNVDLYVAINRPASINDFDCVSRNQTNEEYCGFSGIKGTDVYVLVAGAENSVDANLVVISEGLLNPQDSCTDLEEWSPYVYYPIGTLVMYYGHYFSATQENWGADPFNNHWKWEYLGICQ